MKDITSVIPKTYLLKLANATNNQSLGLVIVLDKTTIEKNNSDQSAGIALEDDGFIVLVPTTLLEELYK